MVWAPGGDVGIEAPRHVGADGAVAFEERKRGNHGVDWSALVGAAERTEHGAGSDGGVEALTEAFLRGGIEIAEGFGKAIVGDATEWAFRAGDFDVDLGFLLDTVGVEEFAGEIDDGFAAPGHAESAGVGDGGNVNAFEVFFVGLGDEVVGFAGIDTDGHAFLGLGDGEFGAVEAVVFLGHSIEVDVEGVGDFADGHGDATCSEVVTDFDFGSELRIAEEALDLALGGSVAFLDLGGVVEGGVGVLLGGAGSAADAIASGASANEKNIVACVRATTEDVFAWSGCDDGADFHALGDVVRVVDLGDLACGEANLVTV